MRKNKEVRDKINIWLSNSEKLSTPYELSIRNLLTIDDLANDYEKFIDKLANDIQTETENGNNWFHPDTLDFCYGALSELKESENTLSDIQLRIPLKLTSHSGGK